MKQLFTYFALFSIVFAFFCCSGSKTEDENDIRDGVQIENTKGDKNTILSELKQNADIATTEVKIRKVGIYDTSKGKKDGLIEKLKIGDRKCIIPVEITITYGYDLRDMSIDDVKITDDSTEVAIFLPKPKIIDTGYNLMIEDESPINITTGLRDEIGHELEEEVRKKTYEEALKEDLWPIVGQEVEHNAKILIESMVQKLGWNNVKISTYGK